jgi:hypothetical protein
VISFRYHLISIIAIFLAIALGVVVGTSALNGAVVGDLRNQVSGLKKANSDAAAQNKALRSQAGNADLLAQTFGSKISGAGLAKTPVVLLGAPGASKQVKDGIAAQITAAGGVVSGRVQLGKSFTDPARANDIRSLATSGVHPIGLQLPTTEDAGMLAGALLGFVLGGKGQGSDLTQVLAGFKTLDMLTTESGTVTAAKAIILVAPGSMVKDSPKATMLLSFSTELGAIAGTAVVAGDAASDTAAGLVALVRNDATAKKSVSTVDNAGTALGQLTVALVTANAVSGHKGHFGSGSGADALLPGVSG